MDAKELGAQPAFPRSHDSDGHNGMTLRQHFAGLAMQAILSGVVSSGGDTSREDADIFAEASVIAADALLSALAKQEAA